MKRNITALLIIICFYGNHTFGQNHDSNLHEIVKVAKYKDDRICAISYTFDDGLIEHYTHVAPQLEKYGFKGTFWVNGTKVNDDSIVRKDTTRVSWGELREMAENGHEISNHGWSHKKLTRLTKEEIITEIQRNDTIIYQQTGFFPLTFCYPYNSKNEEIIELASHNRVATRLKQIAIGVASTTEKLENWVERLQKEEGWGVAMTHGITYGYDSFSDPDILWNHFETVSHMGDSIWVGTFLEVASYIAQREALKYSVETVENGLRIIPQLDLDKEMYSMELTLVIRGEKDFTAIQQDNVLLIQNKPDRKKIFNFDPYAGPIYIYYK